MYGLARKFLPVLLVLSVACGDGGPSGGDVEGAWSGGITEGGSQLGTLTMTLTENQGTISGNGSIAGGASFALTVSGTFSKPSASMTLTSPGLNPFNFTATVGDNTMDGTLNGSGFLNSAVHLTRQ